MNTQDNVTLIKKLYASSMDVWEEHLSENFTWMHPQRMEYDKKGFIDYFNWLYDSLPDIEVPIEIFASEDDNVVVKFEVKATMTKDIRVPGLSEPFKAHNKPISWIGLDLYQFKNGKIIRCETYANSQLVMEQFQS